MIFFGDYIQDKQRQILDGEKKSKESILLSQSREGVSVSLHRRSIHRLLDVNKFTN